jgi:hypothetical protein
VLGASREADNIQSSRVVSQFVILPS